MNKFMYKPMYLDFPIIQIIYIVFWFPLGYIASYFIAFSTINTVARITIFLLDKWDFSFQYYMMSGRLEMGIRPFYLPTHVIYDILILCIGLEIISKFIYKKRLEYEEHSEDGQDACDIQESD